MGRSMEVTMKNQTSYTCDTTTADAACNRLGPYPAASVAALADLGLTDQEIAGYFRVRPERIMKLRLNDRPELRLVFAGD